MRLRTISGQKAPNAKGCIMTERIASYDPEIVGTESTERQRVH